MSMKISGALKRLTKNIITIVKTSSTEEGDKERFNRLLKLARRSTRFEDAAMRASNAKVAVPVDKNTFLAEVDLIKGVVNDEKIRSNPTRGEATDGEVQKLDK